MARKTNKTAHVLNLISKAKDEHQSMDEQMKIDNTGSDVPNDLLFMGIEPSNDISISEKINENLEAFVEQDEPFSVEESEILQTNQSEIVQTGEPTMLQTIDKPQIEEKPIPQRMPEASPEPSPEPSPAPGPEPGPAPSAKAEVAPPVHEVEHTETKNVPAPSVQSKKVLVETPSASAFHYVNVYERLVLERMEEFQTLFEVCTCARCTADVIAIALTNLPAKYIVTDNTCTIPLLSFYREKFKTSVATQLSSACVKVKQKPSHS
ncbi:MAG: hypothetical protein EOM28_10325 [Clostridia bacterium]|nr:hypothetical protein [Clostridia bacterium]